MQVFYAAPGMKLFFQGVLELAQFWVLHFRVVFLQCGNQLSVVVDQGNAICFSHFDCGLDGPALGCIWK